MPQVIKVLVEDTRTNTIGRVYDVSKAKKANYSSLTKTINFICLSSVIVKTIFKKVDSLKASNHLGREKTKYSVLI